MRGTFRTLRFNSRSDFQQGRLAEVHESSNAFTDVGLTWLWTMALGQLRAEDGSLTDELTRARLVVGNGSQEFSPDDARLAGPETDQAAMDTGFPMILAPQEDSLTLRFQGTFGEQDAVFEWGEKGVVTAQGVLLDRTVADTGRKVLGAVWVVQADLELTR